MILDAGPLPWSTWYGCLGLFATVKSSVKIPSFIGCPWGTIRKSPLAHEIVGKREKSGGGFKSAKVRGLVPQKFAKLPKNI